MQNRGSILVFLFLFVVICLYQISFTWVANSVEKDAVEYARNNSSQEKFLYPENVTIQRFKYSDIDPKNIDITKYPEYNKANFVEIILREGNLLFIPRFWWFNLEFLDDTIYVMFNSDTPISKFLSFFT